MPASREEGKKKIEGKCKENMRKRKRKEKEKMKKKWDKVRGVRLLRDYNHPIQFRRVMRNLKFINFVRLLKGIS